MRHLALCIACLVVMVAFVRESRNGNARHAIMLKAVASGLFVAVGVLSAQGHQGCAWLLAGLAAGFVADVVINARYLLKGWGARLAFAGGTAVFLAGHLCYLAYVLPRCPLPVTGMVFGCCLAAVLMAWLAKRIQVGQRMRILGMAYLLVLCVLVCTCAVAFVATSEPSLGCMSLGVVLFLASDVLHVLRSFGTNKSFALRTAYLCLYYAAQLLVALSPQFS